MKTSAALRSGENYSYIDYHLSLEILDHCSESGDTPKFYEDDNRNKLELFEALKNKYPNLPIGIKFDGNKYKLWGYSKHYLGAKK